MWPCPWWISGALQNPGPSVGQKHPGLPEVETISMPVSHLVCSKPTSVPRPTLCKCRFLSVCHYCYSAHLCSSHTQGADWTDLTCRGPPATAYHQKNAIILSYASCVFPDFVLSVAFSTHAGGGITKVTCCLALKHKHKPAPILSSFQ